MRGKANIEVGMDIKLLFRNAIIDFSAFSFGVRQSGSKMYHCVWYTHMGGLFAHNDVLYIRAENTLEQIAVEGVGQNTLKQIGGWWSRYVKIHRAIALMYILHS